MTKQDYYETLGVSRGAGGDNSGNSGNSGNGGGAAEDEVVDADFEEVDDDKKGSAA